MKILYLVLGFISFGLGAVGVVLPILPTAPFLLLSAYCFARASKRANDWFLSTKLYNRHLDSFVKNRTMTLKTKLLILIPVSVLLTGAFFLMSNIYGRIVLFILLGLKYCYFIFKIKTIRLCKSKKVQEEKTTWYKDGRLFFNALLKSPHSYHWNWV